MAKVAERTRMEKALRRSEELLHLVTDDLGACISIVDSKQRYRFNNNTYEEWFGRRRDEITGRHIREVLGEPAYEAIRGHVQVALSGAQVTYDLVLPLKYGGSRDVTVTYNPYFGQRGEVEGFIALVTDITERKRMEEALQKAREELEGKVERQMLRRNPYGLTFRELTVLHLVAVGETDKQIGLKLGISHFTAQKHTSNILAKMGAGSRTEATARALREGLLD